MFQLAFEWANNNDAYLLLWPAIPDFLLEDTILLQCAAAAAAATAMLYWLRGSSFVALVAWASLRGVAWALTALRLALAA